MVSISLGFVEVKRKIKIALIFALAESVMPLVGLFIGTSAGRVIGNWASGIGGIVLVAVAVWFLVFEGDDDELGKLRREPTGWTLVLTALSISLDELAVGFSMGLMGVPVTFTIMLIAVQAFVFTFLGLTLGAKIRPYLGEWAEKLVGIILGAFGIWILIDAIVHMLRL